MEISRYGAKIVSNAVATKTTVLLFVVSLNLVENYGHIGGRYCLIIEAIFPSE
jgi:hypothetical protein